MIKTINLQKIFKTEEVETWALNNVSIEVKQGEFVAIMGPSGCGKSTLLNILGLLDNPTGGEYYLNGTEVSKYTESQRTSLRKGVIGFDQVLQPPWQGLHDQRLFRGPGGRRRPELLRCVRHGHGRHVRQSQNHRARHQLSRQGCARHGRGRQAGDRAAY